MSETTLKQYSHAALSADIDGYIAASRAISPQDMLAAFRSLESYPYRNEDHSPRYFTTEDIVKEASGALDAQRYTKRTAELEAQFQAAKKAFDIVSKQTVMEPNPAIPKAAAIKAELEKLTTSHIWLTPKEYESIKNKTFDAIDVRILTDATQATRAKIETAIRIANEYGRDGRYSRGARFTTHYDPELLAQIEEALEVDTTSSMLLRHAKSEHLPIIFALYDLDEATIRASRGKYGMGYFASPEYPKGETFYFITAFKNIISEASVHAITIAHELRHFRFKSLFKSDEYKGLELQDQIIAMLLDEADAQSVYRKVAWSLRNKNLPVGTYASAADDLARYFNKPLYGSLSPSHRLQRATQDCFAGFIYTELKNPVYLKMYVDGYVQQGLKLGTATRKIDQSRLLSDDFLTRLSKVTENVSYLDAQGMKAVQEMIKQKLPEVLERLEQQALAAKGQKPEP